MKKALHIKTSGETIEVEPQDGKYFSLEELQKFVGGYVEIVPLPSGAVLICNEEGKLIPLPVNAKATELWYKEYPKDKYDNSDIIMGDVLIASNDQLEQ